MDNRFGEMETFVRAVSEGSFSAAGRALGMTPSAVSRVVSRLEDRLQARLLVRSTRALVPTPEGEAYLAEAREILDRLAEMEARMAQGATPRGPLRVSATVGFGAQAVLPLVPRFLEAHSGIDLDLTLTDGVIDLWQERVDLAIRSGTLRDSALKARRVARMRRVVVGAPDYLARRGVPVVPGDLIGHDCLRYNFRPDDWPFRDPATGARVLQRVCGPFSASDGTILRHVCLAGTGLMWTGDVVVAEDLAQGRLVEVLADWQPPEPEEIHAVFAGHPHLASRIRAFVDFLSEAFGRDAG
ncbi:LysR family transcriptional regulator [Poseidonocella sp. HB161398]|uniref:LysR family transcriptional regulator n=1 Tax=Poseidonocella sp. HB161398 TaxID=2320855 RepID=UPI00110842C1|nr:LysR family transcriptional regulator [Poseidonocella sp. HB161398]